MGDDDAWNATCKEWLIDEGYCFGGGVAGKSDCVFYGAAAMAGVEKWEAVFQAASDREIPTGEDDTKETNWIDETTVLWEIITKGVKGNFKGGVWLGGRKYTLVRAQDIPIEGTEVTVYSLARPKGGGCIACSHQSVVVAFNDEEKGQEKGNVTKAVCNFVGYLMQCEG